MLPVLSTNFNACKVHYAIWVCRFRTEVIHTFCQCDYGSKLCHFSEFQLRRNPDAFKDQHLPLEVNYDASKHTPVFFGDLHKRVSVDGRVEEDFDAAVSHPACVGYAFVKRPPESPPPAPPAIPDRSRSKFCDEVSQIWWKTTLYINITAYIVNCPLNFMNIYLCSGEMILSLF